MLTEKLKVSTRHNHQQLEKQLVQRMKAIHTLPEYVALLQLFYTYFGALEKRIDLYITPAYLPDYHQRRKAAALAQDITDLGSELAPEAGADHLPAIHNRLQAFGALYVIEGSTLGGQIISKMMEKQLPLPTGRGLLFFKGYGEHSGAMWAAFTTALNAQVHIAAEEETVIAAANQTFFHFEQWMHKSSNMAEQQKI